MGTLLSSPERNGHNRIINPDTGRPFNDNGLYLPDGMAVPHVIQFSSIMAGGWHAYFHGKFDEARKNSRADSLAMRNDCELQGMLQERKLATASLPWHIETDDDKDPVQIKVAEHIKKVILSFPFFRKMVFTLMDALWFGRYGIQLKWKWDYIRGVKSLCADRWFPVNGDKIGHLQDHTPYVMINPSAAGDYEDLANIGYTTEGGAFLPLRGSWRDRFIIHSHEVDDADFLDMFGAEAVHGVGIRSRIYWLDWLRREWLSNLTDFIEKAGLGVTIWYYQMGNEQSKTAVTNAAKEHTGSRTNLLVPILENQKTPSIERMEVPMSGADLLLKLQDRVSDIINRYINGQHLSSSSRESGGLGNEAAAEFQMDTKRQIRNFDAGNLEETLTGNARSPGLVYLIQRWTFPKTIPGPDNPNGFMCRFKFALEDDQSSEKLANASTLIQVGLPVKTEEVYSAGGFTKPGDDDDVVGGQPPMAQPGAPPPAGPGQPGAPPDGQPPQPGPEGGSPPAPPGSPKGQLPVVPDQWEQPSMYQDEPAPTPKPPEPAKPPAPKVTVPKPVKAPSPAAPVAPAPAPKPPHATTHEELAKHPPGQQWEAVQTTSGQPAWRNPYTGHVEHTPHQPTQPAEHHAREHVGKMHTARTFDKLASTSGIDAGQLHQLARQHFGQWEQGSGQLLKGHQDRQAAHEDAYHKAFADLHSKKKDDDSPVSPMMGQGGPEPEVEIQGNRFKTGSPAEFEFMRNTTPAPKATPGGHYSGQDVEPHGRYMTAREQGDFVPEGWESGKVKFNNPLIVDWGKGLYSDPDNWKKVLSEKFGGKTGKELSKAVADAGHDGILTVRDGKPSEIVDLTSFHPPAADSPISPMLATREKHIHTPEFENFFGPWKGKKQGFFGKRTPPEPGEVSQVTDTYGGRQGTGKPVKVYHGSGKGGFEEFDPKFTKAGLFNSAGEKAFYFTEDPGVGDSYHDKEQGLEFVGDRDEGMRRWMGEFEKLRQSGHYDDLDYKEGVETLKKYGPEGMFKRGNYDPQDWDTLHDLYREAGSPKTYETYLNIRKPFDADKHKFKVADLPEPFQKAYQQSDQHDVDMLDLDSLHEEIDSHQKRLKDPGLTDSKRQYLEREIANNQKSIAEIRDRMENVEYGLLAESMPKDQINQLLRSQGYDGITHIGGNRMGGGHEHRVWIAFEPTQIKSTDNRGTFDPTDPNIHRMEGQGQPGEQLAQNAPQSTPAQTPAQTPAEPPSEHHAALVNLATQHLDTADHLSPEQKQHFGDVWGQAVGKMTPEAAQMAAKNLKGVHFEPSWQAAMIKGHEETIAHGEQHGMDPAVIERTKKDLADIRSGQVNPAAMFSAWTNKIYSDGLEGPQSLDNPSDPAAHRKHGLEAINLHEMAHAVDGPKKELSNSIEWYHAFVDEIVGPLRDDGLNADVKPKLTMYAESNTEEGFAEFFRLTHSGFDPKVIEQKFPRAAAFFKQKQLWPHGEQGQGAKPGEPTGPGGKFLPPEGKPGEPFGSPEANPVQPMHQPAETAGVDLSDPKVVEHARKEWLEKGTESPYFKRWFGESKTVDEQGQLVRFYHGTPKEIRDDAFRPGAGRFGKGIYISANPKKTGAYAGDNEGAHTFPLYAKIEKPMFVLEPVPTEAYPLLAQEISKRINRPLQFSEKRELDQLRDKNADFYDVRRFFGGDYHELAKALGYDATVGEYGDENDPKTWHDVNVLSPEQIKSATGNRGTFDPTDPNISRMEGLDHPHLANLSPQDFLQQIEQMRAGKNPVQPMAEVLRQIDPQKFIAKSGIPPETLKNSKGVMTAQDILRNPPADLKGAIPLGLSTDPTAGVPEIYFHMSNVLGMKSWLAHYAEAFAGRSISHDPAKDTEDFMQHVKASGKPLVMFVPGDPGNVPSGKTNYTQEELKYLQKDQELAQRTYFVFGLYDMIHPDDAGKHIHVDEQGNPRGKLEQSNLVRGMLKNPEEHQSPISAMKAPDHPLFRGLGDGDVRKAPDGVKWVSDGGSDPLPGPAEFVRPQADARKRLGTNERQGIQLYSDSFYRSLNKALRDDPDDPSKMHQNHQNMLKVLNQALGKAPELEHPVNVWRGIKLASVQEEKDFREFVKKTMQNGHLLQMAAMQSSSIHPETAFGFTAFSEPLVFEIKGKKGLYLDNIEGNKLSTNPGEFEFLMPHNTVYRITGMKTVPFVREFEKKPVKYDVIQLEQAHELHGKPLTVHETFRKANRAVTANYQRDDMNEERSESGMTREDYKAWMEMLAKRRDKFQQDVSGIRAVAPPEKGVSDVQDHPRNE